MKTKYILSFLLMVILATVFSVAIEQKTGLNAFVPLSIIVISSIVIAKTHVLHGAFAVGVFSDLLWEDGADNMPGFTQIAYLGLRGDIATWPTLNSSPTTAAEKIRLSGTYVMEPDKKFYQVYSTKNKSSAKAEMQGEDDCKSFKCSGKLFYPGSAEECLAFAASLKNQRGTIILVEPSGERKNFGTQLLPVYFKVTVEYGETVTGAKGMTIEWECDSNEPGYTYHGVIPVTGGDVPAIS